MWHLGASLAVQDVDGTNLWGGRTYVRDTGYTWRDDHGGSPTPVEAGGPRTGWRTVCSGATGTAGCCSPSAAGSPRPGGRAGAWALDVDYTPHRPRRTGTSPWAARPPTAAPAGPATAGSSGGPSPHGEPVTFTADADGEETVNGSAAPWVALTGVGPGGGAYTLVFTGLGPGDRWFVRTAMYPGVCVAFAFDRPAVVPGRWQPARPAPGAVADGILDRDGAAALLAAAEPA